MKADAQKKPNTQKSPKPKARKKTPKSPEHARFYQDCLDIETARRNAFKATGMTEAQLQTILNPICRAVADGQLLPPGDLIDATNLVSEFAPKTAYERMICGQLLSTYFFMNVNMHLGMRASLVPIRTSLFQTATKLGHLNKGLLEMLHRLQNGEDRKVIAFEYNHVTRKEAGPDAHAKPKQGKRKQEGRPVNGSPAMNGHAMNGHALNGHGLNGHARNRRKPKCAQRIMAS
ncbi:hypothetical protein [uncultured Parvibaculum sp.]|uniref:hypothetical protein n=1 Tax=uncultured Parvibaculum sp. TaxID=291828 RepID=UPI0030DCB1E9|tara:strand:+ start:124 stop:819 length:696 start_codon:yes stop_codon:yes gene_type:complete